MVGEGAIELFYDGSRGGPYKGAARSQQEAAIVGGCEVSKPFAALPFCSLRSHLSL